jgi:hypothetical protein
LVSPFLPVADAPVRQTKLLFIGVLVTAGLVQMALFIYASATGLAGTSDSRLYLHAAQTLRDTGHLLNPDGTPYRYWPPLYPMLLRVCGALPGVRALQGGCLVGSLLLWSWLGRQLLPAWRALTLPILLALSTPWLLVSKFVWAEGVFVLLFAGYAAALFLWLHTGRCAWWTMATLVGMLLPLQRTLGLFLLAGIGAGLLLGAWRWLSVRQRWVLCLHLFLSGSGGVLWQCYALIIAGPSRYHPGRGWGQLLSSGADFGFVLARWLLLLPASGRLLLPNVVWFTVLLGLFVATWPRKNGLGNNTSSLTDALLVQPLGIAQQSGAWVMLRGLWSAALSLIILVAGLTVFAQSAAGIHDAERYASVLFAPLLVLVLAAWPTRAPQWLNAGLLLIWLLSTAVRVGHVARDLHRVPPLAPALFSSPRPHGQRVETAHQ